MAERARSALLGIVAGMVGVGGCSGDDEGPAVVSTSIESDSSTAGSVGGESPEDRTLVITEAMWAATGLDRAQVSVGSYRYDFVGDHSAACVDLPEDDRWVGDRDSSVAPSVGTQIAIEEALSDHFRGIGLTVRHYRQTHPAARGRGLEAVGDDVKVLAYLSEDGHTAVTVRVGPCATRLGRFGDTYELDD
ncbi:MAG: hypothetical protein ACK5OX_14730 [Desertimonas sp.]